MLFGPEDFPYFSDFITLVTSFAVHGDMKNESEFEFDNLIMAFFGFF